MTSDPGPGDPLVSGILRRYWRVAGVHPRHILLPLVLAFVVGGLEGASFWMLVPLSDAVAAGGFSELGNEPWLEAISRLLPGDVSRSPRVDAYVALALILLLFFGRFARLGVEYARALYVHKRNARYTRMVRDETFARVLGFGRSYFERHPIGHVESELEWSVSVVRILAAVEDIVLYSLRLVVKVALILVISPALFVAFVASVLVLQFLLKRISAAAGELAADAAAIQKRGRREVLDLLGAIPLVKAYVQEEHARRLHHEILEDSEGVEVRQGRLHHLSYPLEEGVVLVGILIAESLILTLGSGSPIGHLARFCAFFLVAQQCLPDVKAIAAARVSVAEQRPLLEALARLFRDEDKYTVVPGTRAWTGVRRAIETRGLRFGYLPGREVLQGVDAVFPAGRFTALVGKSGAGKTSLIDLVTRQYECPPGSIFVDDVDVREFEPAGLHRGMVVASQEVWLLNRSLRENLTFGLEPAPSDAELIEVLGDVGLRGLVEEQVLGLDAELGDRGIRLSGGQRQRVALARALLRSPDVLVLDEATSALDSVTEQRVFEACRRRLPGATLIVIAHRLSTLREADQILVMEEGRVVERGTWEDLLSSGGLFKELHEAQDGARAGVAVSRQT